MKSLIIFLSSLLFFTACKTEEPKNSPVVVTKVASDITTKSATLNGEVTEEGYSATTDRGFVFSDKNSNPSVSDTKVQSGYGKGIYSVVLDKLSANSKYFYKAYATNAKGTSYGELQSFTSTDYKLATVNTDLPKNVTYTTVELGGFVLDEGGGIVSESGFVVGTNPLPTILDLKFPISKGKSSIAIVISKLNFNTKYFVRTYALNEKGISYGNEQSFTTNDYKLASLITDIPKNIGYNSVEFLGNIKDNGGGNIKESGFVYSTTPITSENAATSNIIVASNTSVNLDIWINNLKINTKYYVRSYAFNEKGVSLGNEQTFTTLNVSTVTSKTGRIWMDRNLGASQVATNPNDEKSFGDLYQWGRGIDGHQLRNSKTVIVLTADNLISNDMPNNPGFYSGPPSFPDWKNPQNNNLWQGISGINNVCPTGFRTPTIEELNSELNTWSEKNSDGAFNSVLKLPLAGSRSWLDGLIRFGDFQTSNGYWSSSSTPITYNNTFFAQYLILSSSASLGARIFNTTRREGRSVRCIKN